VTPTSRRTPAPLREPDIPDELTNHDGPIDDDTRLDAVDLTGTWVEQAFDGVEIKRSRLSGARLTGSTLDHLVMEDVVAVDCELSGVTFTDAVLQRVHFVRCRMAGLVAADLNAKDVRVTDCQVGEAWLRMATLERCELDGCDLRNADFYGARLKDVRILRSQLDDTEWSKAAADSVALHGSSLTGMRGVEALRNLVIGGDQLLPLAVPILRSLGIVVDDDYLDP
jgi:uncharacterized protein YjbI with pentapeptide repeats